MLCVCVCVCMCVQSCLALCDPMNCSPSGSPVHGIFQARILEYVAISSSRGSSPPRDKPLISCISCPGKRILCSTLFFWISNNTHRWKDLGRLTKFLSSRAPSSVSKVKWLFGGEEDSRSDFVVLDFYFFTTRSPKSTPSKTICTQWSFLESVPRSPSIRCCSCHRSTLPNRLECPLYFQYQHS